MNLNPQDLPPIYLVLAQILPYFFLSLFFSPFVDMSERPVLNESAKNGAAAVLCECYECMHIYSNLLLSSVCVCVGVGEGREGTVYLRLSIYCCTFLITTPIL